MRPFGFTLQKILTKNSLIISLILSSTLFSCFQCLAQTNNTPLIDKDFKQRLEALKENKAQAISEEYQCQIAWTSRDAKPADPYSTSPKPQEFTIFYANKPVLHLLQSKGERIENITENMICLKRKNFVYIFWDTIPESNYWNFNLAADLYVTYSDDSGATWSKFSPLHEFINISAPFRILKRDFFKYLHILGDDKNHIFIVNNRKDANNYLVDSDLRLLRTVPSAQQFPELGYPLNEFHFFNGKIYLTRRACHNVQDGTSCLDTSEDYGRTWKTFPMPSIRSSRFLTYQNTLFHFYIEYCPPTLPFTTSIPALDDKAWCTCGELKVSILDSNLKWSKPTTLLKTAKEFQGVYLDGKNFIIAWKDFRFEKLKPCSFIPIFGCIDSSSTEGPSSVVFATEFNMASFSLGNEHLIEFRQ